MRDIMALLVCGRHIVKKAAKSPKTRHTAKAWYMAGYGENGGFSPILYATQQRGEVTATNTRIKKLRKALDLTQAEFASRIGTTQNSVANYETGHRNPSSSVINNICKEFHVNETWLRTGSGDMFREMSRDDEIAAFVEDVLRDESDDFKRRFISALSHLDAAGWDALEQLVEDTARQKSAEKPVPPGYSSRAELEAEADEFAAMAREQFLSEKIPGYQASFASDSDDSGGVA